MQTLEFLNVNVIHFGPSFKPPSRPHPNTHQLLFPHAHPNYHQLLLIRKGEAERILEGTAIQSFDDQTLINCRQERRVVTPASEGHVLINPRGIVHQLHCLESDVDSLWVSWTETPRRTKFTYPIHSYDTDGSIRLRLEKMLNLWPPRSPVDRLSLQRLFKKVLQSLHPIDGSTFVGLNQIKRVKDYIRENLDRPICLEDLAKVAGLSRYHFSRRFTSATGISPMRFVRQMRVEAAQTQLLATSSPLSVIAPLVGFRDEFHLSHVFGKVTGTSPGNFRKQLLT